jgi:hypothetical protein
MTKFELASMMGLEYLRSDQYDTMHYFRYHGIDFDEYVISDFHDRPIEYAKERAAERIFEAIADCIGKFNLL